MSDEERPGALVPEVPAGDRTDPQLQDTRVAKNQDSLLWETAKSGAGFFIGYPIAILVVVLFTMAAQAYIVGIVLFAAAYFLVWLPLRALWRRGSGRPKSDRGQ